MIICKIIIIVGTAKFMFLNLFRKDCFCAWKDKATRNFFGQLFAIFYELTFRINVSLSLTSLSTCSQTVT